MAGTTMAETLREMITGSRSLYIVAKEAKVSYSALHRFVHDDNRHPRLDFVQRLVDYFGLELRPKATQRRTKT
jgi:DNA-binding phage protein